MTCRSGLLTVEPAEQHRDRARVVAQPAAAVRDHAELGVTVRLRQSDRVVDRHDVVLGPVEHEQRTAARSAGRSRPRRPRRSPAPTPPASAGARRSRSTPMLRQCRANRAASRAQSRRSTGAPTAATPRTRRSRAADADGERATDARPHDPHPGAVTVGRDLLDGEAQVGVPALDREVAVRAAGAPEVEGEHAPSRPARRCGRRARGRSDPTRATRAAGREVVTEHQTRRGRPSMPVAPSAPRARCRRAFDRQVHRGSSSRVTIILAIVTATAARRPAVQGVGGRRARPARGRADPRRPQGRHPRGRPPLLGPGRRGCGSTPPSSTRSPSS